MQCCTTVNVSQWARTVVTARIQQCQTTASDKYHFQPNGVLRHMKQQIMAETPSSKAMNAQNSAARSYGLPGSVNGRVKVLLAAQAAVVQSAQAVGRLQEVVLDAGIIHAVPTVLNNRTESRSRLKMQDTDWSNAALSD